MHIKKHLNFEALRQTFSAILYKLSDNRQKGKIEYRLHDIVMSGFAYMFLQCPSLLEYQRQIEDKKRRNNLMTQFNIQKTPQDTVIREGIDEVASNIFAEVFRSFLNKLQRGKQLLAYQFMPGLYLLSIDGSQFHSSSSIYCNLCLTKEKRGGGIHYSHQAIQSAIVHPDKKVVFPMMPEAIFNIDGQEKQDCEINAAKRMMPKLKKQHPRLKSIRLADSLYAKTPFIKQTIQEGDHFIFSINSKDHKYLFEQVRGLTLNRHDEIDEKGRKLIYEWCNNLQLFKDNSDLQINFMRFRISTPQKNGENKVTYVGNWISDLPLNQNNIIKMTKGARCKWHIENECFNTLKNQGYCMEHNFGHGEKNLCFNFYILTVLAFYIHQIFELTDRLYKMLRNKVGTLKNVWMTLRVLFNRYIYESWNDMLLDAYDHDEYIKTHPPPQ